MENYISNLIKKAGVESEFLQKDISKQQLFELIAEVGKRNPREIVRKLNGLIVMWRIRKNESTKNESSDDKHSLIGLLINEVTGEEKYKPFCINLSFAPEGKDKTIGEFLADAFACPEVTETTDHIPRIKKGTRQVKAAYF